MEKGFCSTYTHEMLLLWLLWIIVVFGGLYMGLGALLTMIGNGFDFALALNFIIYSGCALYGAPKLLKLFAGKG
jgi:hypothetical protein